MEAAGKLSGAGRTMTQGRLQENTPSDATTPRSAVPAWLRQNMPQKNTFLLQGLATFQFYLLILFICVPQKNVCRLYLLSAELHHLPVTFNILFLF